MPQECRPDVGRRGRRGSPSEIGDRRAGRRHAGAVTRARSAAGSRSGRRRAPSSGRTGARMPSKAPRCSRDGVETAPSELQARDRQIAAARTSGRWTGRARVAASAARSRRLSAEDRGQALAEATGWAPTSTPSCRATPRLAAAEAELAALRPQLAADREHVRAERDARQQPSSRRGPVARCRAAVERSRSSHRPRAAIRTRKVRGGERLRELDFLRARLNRSRRRLVGRT